MVELGKGGFVRDIEGVECLFQSDIVLDVVVIEGDDMWWIFSRGVVTGV